VAYRRLHTAVRIKADLLLHHFGRPVEDAVRLYREHMQFSPGAARGQVDFQQLWPGYMTIYYYGQEHLDEIDREPGSGRPHHPVASGTTCGMLIFAVRGRSEASLPQSITHRGCLRMCANPGCMIMGTPHNHCATVCPQ